VSREPPPAPPVAPRAPAASRAPAAEPRAPAPAAAAAAAHERIPGLRASRLRVVAVNAVALAALLAVAAAILVVWRNEGRLGAGALRPSAVIAALRRSGPDLPFAAHEVRSGVYERERAPPLLFVRGEVVSRAPSAVGRVRVSVEVVRAGQVLARGEAVAGAVPTAEELWSAGDTAALDAAARAAESRAPAEVRPGDAVPFLVAIADAPADLAGASLRVLAAAGDASP